MESIERRTFANSTPELGDNQENSKEELIEKIEGLKRDRNVLEEIIEKLKKNHSDKDREKILTLIKEKQDNEGIIKDLGFDLDLIELGEEIDAEGDMEKSVQGLEEIEVIAAQIEEIISDKIEKNLNIYGGETEEENDIDVENMMKELEQEIENEK